MLCLEELPNVVWVTEKVHLPESNPKSTTVTVLARNLLHDSEPIPEEWAWVGISKQIAGPRGALGRC